MREDLELCTYHKFHKHKIIFFLSAMRAYRDELNKSGYLVKYQNLGETQSNEKISYESALLKFIREKKIKKIYLFEIEDKFFEKRILDALKKTYLGKDLEVEVWPSPMFLTLREDFKTYLKGSKRPFMKTFYERQRKRLKILVDSKGQPKGGQWSYDTENRLPLPKDMQPPGLLKFSNTKHIKDVSYLCDLHFSKHPGSSESFWLPVKRAEAQKWLDDFLKNKLVKFGPYEDALAPHSDFVFHSVLTPFLNVGLLTPKEVIEQTLVFSKKNKVPLASLEGFVRQIIGWREFIRGIYQNYSEKQDSLNFWKHKRKLSPVWYEGGASLPQLQRTLDKVFKYSYCHHIERLMVLGNLMLLLEVHPKEAYSWFMEMFIDSSDWVMGPNIYGMALFSDGGLFATKPYICGSNYWRKMSKEKSGDWCDGLDGLYWGFVEKHRDFFSKNPRLSMMVKSLDRMDESRKKKIFKSANALKKELTC